MLLTRPDLPLELTTLPDLGAQATIRHLSCGNVKLMTVLAGFDVDGENRGLHHGIASSICAMLSGHYFTATRDAS